MSLREQRVITDGIIRHNGKFLIIKRSSKENIFPNKWELPSGKVNFGEDPNEAILREIKEETGIVPEKIELYKVKHHTFEIKKGIRHNVQLLFLIEPKDSSVVLSDAHDDFAWVDIDELNKYDIFEDVAEVLKETKLKVFKNNSKV